MTSKSSFGYIRATFDYPTLNLTQPGLIFGGGSCESFDTQEKTTKELTEACTLFEYHSAQFAR
jgi:hypothetical protein